MGTMPDPTPDAQSTRPERAAPLGRIAQRSRAELLAEALTDRIRRQGQLPGSFVGTLDGIRSETGHAYPTVSEAVRLLRERGVIDIRPGRGGGLFVADTSPLVRLRQTLLEVGDDATTIADVIELREHLESLINVSAARHCGAADASALEALLAGMDAADDWDDFMHANWALHERIADICPNDLARAVYLATLGQLSTTRARLDTDDGRYRRRRMQIHVDLVTAIVAGDENQVRRAVQRHNGGTR